MREHITEMPLLVVMNAKEGCSFCDGTGTDNGLLLPTLKYWKEIHNTHRMSQCQCQSKEVNRELSKLRTP